MGARGPKPGSRLMTFENTERGTSVTLALNRHEPRLSKRQEQKAWKELEGVPGSDTSGQIGEWPPFQSCPEVPGVYYCIEPGDGERLYAVPYTPEQRDAVEEAERGGTTA